MILMAGFIIGIAATIIEVKLVTSWAWLGNAYENGIHKGPINIPSNWINILCSWGISFVLGGGPTIIALLGMMTSTLFSIIYFSQKKALNKAGWSVARIKSETHEKGERGAQWWTKNKVHFVNLGKTIMVTIKIITAPIRLAIYANDKVHDGKDHLVAAKHVFDLKVNEVKSHFAH